MGLPRILIVDDDRMIRTMVREAVEAIGFDVQAAKDGREGLRATKDSPPQLIILDVQMPYIDGYTMCEAVRRLEPTKEIPVLILTVHGDAKSVQRAFEAGATDFIAKPFDPQILQHRVLFMMRASNAFDELRKNQERLAGAQRLARIGHWEWDPRDAEMLWSEELYRILEMQPLPGASAYPRFLQMVHPADREAVEKSFTRSLSDGMGWNLEHRMITTTGAERIVHQRAEIPEGSPGASGRLIGTVQDITERRRSEESIRRLAYYDTLTSLPNRRMMMENLTRVIERARRGGLGAGVLFLDLDRFKRINDTFGHETGDELLKAVAERVLDCVRTSDFVGRAVSPQNNATLSRLGGDEFTIVLSDLRKGEDAAVVARRIIQGMREPFVLRGREVVMSTSIGVSVFPTDGPDSGTLLKNADTALYHAKDSGRGNFQFFCESMNTRAMQQLQLEVGLRSAIQHEELILHYQPKCEARSGRIAGMEALVRWRRPDGGLALPMEFIPIAEETGLILPLGEWVIRKASAQNRAWQEAGLPPLPVAVNVSAHQLRKPGFLEIVKNALQDSCLDPGLLEIEITESALMEDEAAVKDTLDGLKRLGVRLSLDDFGTGYSSLGQLSRLPLDGIKIDRCFLANVGSGTEGAAIFPAVVAMAGRLGLTVTAEGVETPEQKSFLESQDCDYLQGYLISPPLEADEFADFFRKHS